MVEKGTITTRCKLDNRQQLDMLIGFAKHVLATASEIKLIDSAKQVLDSVENGQLLLASCGRREGRWHCVTHAILFPNQAEKDGHIAEGDHVLCWICPEHGPEVP